MYMTKLKDYAEIYVIKSPSGNKYVGKANCLDSKSKKHGTLGRWKGHLRDARQTDGGRCRLLNEEIRMYPASEFEVLPIAICKVNDTWYWERSFIKEYNTLCDPVTNPNGLNINEGGNSGFLSIETRALMSKSRRKYLEYHPESTAVSPATRKKIAKSIIDNVKRYDHNGQLLPKYMKYVEWSDRRGYQIVSHPKCKCKYFVSKKTTLHDLYEECVNELNKLNMDT